MWVDIEGDGLIGAVLQVTHSALYVAPMGGDGCCTLFVRPGAKALTVGIHRTTDELSLCLKSPATQGFLIEALVDSPVIEEMNMREDEDGYTVTLFLANGMPIILPSDENNIGELLATALYEVYSLQDRTVESQLICH